METYLHMKLYQQNLLMCCYRGCRVLVVWVHLIGQRWWRLWFCVLRIISYIVSPWQTEAYLELWQSSEFKIGGRITWL